MKRSPGLYGAEAYVGLGAPGVGGKARGVGKVSHEARVPRNTWWVPRWLKFIVGVALLPVCAGGCLALWNVLYANGGADATWLPLMAGAVCWGVVYLLLPRPMWVYVAGHELTHAIWVWLFGGEVRRLRIGARGGHVVVSKSNFLIALAPYFFPFYAVLVVLMFLVASWFWPGRMLQVWFHLALGAAYAFHLTLTGHVLKTQQSDITENRYPCSVISDCWVFSTWPVRVRWNA